MKIKLNALQIKIIIQLLTDKHDWFVSLGKNKAARAMADIAWTINKQKE